MSITRPRSISFRSPLLLGVFLLLCGLGATLAHAQAQAPTPTPPPAPPASDVRPQVIIERSVLTTGDVLRMVEAKLGDDLIIGKIKASKCDFDTSIDAILKLKAAGVSEAVIQAMVAAGAAASAEAKAAATAAAVANAPPADPNDPRSPHDAGIYWVAKAKRSPQMMQLEPSAYSGGKTGGLFKSAMTYGIAKAKWKAVVRSPRATLRVSEDKPEFWFYFEQTSHGLSQSGAFGGGASSANEFILAKMDKKGDSRELIVGEFGAFGSSTGTRSKDVMDIEFKKIAPGIYQVTATKTLPPGEYCFFYAGTNVAMGMSGGKLFDFGIDPAR